MRTYDTQSITVRQVNALNFNNSVIDPNRVLTTDGAGGTYWAMPATLTPYGGLNELVVDNKTIISDLSYNRFYLETAQGMGSIVDTTAKRITLYSKGFDTIDISGGNTINSLSNSILSPTFTLIGRNGVSISSDPLTRSIYIQGGNPMVSTGIYGYSQLNVISNASTVTVNTIKNLNKTVLNSTSPSTLLSFAGVGDILLSTNVTQNIVFIGISSFTSKGYHDLSGVAYGTFSSCMSTVSSLFTNNNTINTLSNAFTSSLISTTKTLEFKIQRTDNNMIANYVDVEAFRLLSQEVVNLKTFGVQAQTQPQAQPQAPQAQTLYSYASTLNVDTHRGLLNGIIKDYSEYTLSSVSFRLDSMSTLLTEKTQISLSYSPSIKFNFNTPIDNTLFVSTVLMAGTEIFPITTFVRPWNLYKKNSYLVYHEQMYTDTINTTFNSDIINNISLRSSYTFLHRIEYFNIANYTVPPSIEKNTNSISFPANFLPAGNNTLSILLTGNIANN